METEEKSQHPLAVLADDSRMMRAQLRDVLTSYGFKIAEEVSNGLVVVSVCLRVRPTVLVIDTSMPGLSWSRAQAELREAVPEMVILDSAGKTPDQLAAAIENIGRASQLRAPLN